MKGIIGDLDVLRGWRKREDCSRMVETCSQISLVSVIIYEPCMLGNRLERM